MPPGKAPSRALASDGLFAFKPFGVHDKIDGKDEDEDKDEDDDDVNITTDDDVDKDEDEDKDEDDDGVNSTTDDDKDEDDDGVNSTTDDDKDEDDDEVEVNSTNDDGDDAVDAVADVKTMTRPELLSEFKRCHPGEYGSERRKELSIEIVRRLDAGEPQVASGDDDLTSGGNDLTSMPSSEVLDKMNQPGVTTQDTHDCIIALTQREDKIERCLKDGKEALNLAIAEELTESNPDNQKVKTLLSRQLVFTGAIATSSELTLGDKASLQTQLFVTEATTQEELDPTAIAEALSEVS
jgi:hypothetical protein